MEGAEVERTLAACEQALAGGGRVDLRALGFWRAVDAVKRSRELVDRYADRIGAIDRGAFERAVRPTFPLAFGALDLALAAALGVVLVAVAGSLPADGRGAALVLGAAAVLGATHDLAHLVFGTVVGIRFTRWFLDGPTRLQPGLKIDYASYLRAAPQARAWMHASGAVVTKIVPFAAIAVGFLIAAPGWALALLGGIGLVQIVTDLLFSVKRSDWKRFRREMRLARRLGA